MVLSRLDGCWCGGRGVYVVTYLWEVHCQSPLVTVICDDGCASGAVIVGVCRGGETEEPVV